MVTEQPEAPKPSSPAPDSPLPRGRHDFPPDVVERHQRERLVAAVATVIAERGYGGLTVERVIAVARVSRTTFYNHFANRHEAVIGAHEQVFGRFLALVVEACEPQVAWAEKVSAGIGAVLAFADAQPAQAQLLAAGFLAADLNLARRVRVSYDQLVALLAPGRRLYPDAASLPALTEQALVGGIATMLARDFIDEGPRRSARLHSQLTHFALLPYLGPVAAGQTVAGA